MRRFAFVRLVVAALAVSSAHAQSFPFEDAFTAYEPGSTGAPAWSILNGMFATADGVLTGPVTVRFNARPPQQYVADLTVDLRGATNAAAPDIAVYLNHQHNADVASADAVILRTASDKPGQLELLTSVDRPGEPPSLRRAALAAMPNGSVTLRLVVDAELGRFTALLDGKPAVSAAPLEYAGGLFSIRLGDGASLDRIILRPPTADEKRSVLLTKLFNDPRDLADADDGNLFVLHRSSPAVLTVTPDGEITRTFGRRVPGGIPDPVALSRGPHGEVSVLNRVPGEVVVFERNGGIRSRFGAGRLREPSDFVILPNGTTYVAEPGERRLSVFGADRGYLGAVTAFGSGGTPVRLGHDPFGNIVVMLANPDRLVVLRPGPDRLAMALVSESAVGVSDVEVVGGRLLAYSDAAVRELGAAGDGPVFRAESVGGLDPGGRLGLAGETAYALDRARGRLVAVPSDLKDTKPSISFLNLAQSAALVRWTSARPALDSRVRLTLDDKDWPEKVTNKAPVTEHQVPLANLKPGRTYRYAVAPTVATIPPTDWSVEYSFETASAGAIPPAGASDTATPTVPAGPLAGATGEDKPGAGQMEGTR